MRKINKVVALVYLMHLSSLTSAQTAGSGILATIDAKANQIEQNDIKVGELNKQHLETYNLEFEKLTKLKRELSSLNEEKEEALDELRRGRFCKGCSRTASQLRKQGVGNVEQHFRQNGGTRPATPEEIAKKEKEFDDKITVKQKEIKDFEFGENEFTRKRTDLDKQMSNLKQQSNNLRDEIIELSKRYKDTVVKEGKSITLSYVNPLLKITADKHYIEDRINIIAVKMNDLSNEENEAVRNAREKARKDIEEKKAVLQSKINNNNTLLVQLNNANINRTSPLKTKLSELNLKLNDIKSKLSNTNSKTDEDIQKLKDDQFQTENLIAEIQKSIIDYDNDYATRKAKIEVENEELADKIWRDYTVNYTKTLDEAENTVQKAYALRRKILADAKTARITNLQQTGQLLIDEMYAKRKKFMEYATIVDKERVRLLNACSKAGCSCFGIDTHGTIVGNWNSSESCIGQMENRHSDSVYYSNCTEEAAIYQGYYASNINGLSDSDLEAFQRKIGKVRFDLITRKITD